MSTSNPRNIRIIISTTVMLVLLLVMQKNYATGFNEIQMNSALSNPQFTINNIDIKHIDESLAAIYPLSCDVWSGFEFEECLALEENDVFFQVEGDYNYDGLNEQYHTGYAQYESGQWVKYLLVLNHQLDVVAFKVIELDGLTDEYNFTGIYQTDSQVYWVECISCDVIYAIKVFEGNENFVAATD
ncbi:hypothetical protein [Marinicellulosiphila megalodicopiae]|uniref:hypothetical protein n=1 Tax=Marinicellulosiphila megalodicopiae TaxID=2724896 RepID=UPI003BAE4E0A